MVFSTILAAAAGQRRRLKRPSASSGLLTASISATQISGPAPLGVVFDATQTLRAGWDIATVFRRITYTFNYGKSAVYSPGTYTRGNQANNSKDQDVGGPIAATVFEQPGTYTVSVLADDNTGNSHTTTITIVVDDPEVYWTSGGRTTRYISAAPGGNFAGAPAANGSTIFHQESTAALAPVANTRHLYRCGETFTGTATVPRNSTTGANIAIGSFATGARPTITVEVNTAFPPVSGQTWARNISLYGLNFPSELVQHGSVENLLIHNCIASSPNAVSASILIGNSVTFWAANGTNGTTGSDYYWPRGVVISETEINSANGTTITGIYSNGMRRSAIIGCWHRGNVTEHNVRVTYSNRCFYAHSSFEDPGTDGRHHLKLHAHGSDLSDPATLAGFASYAVGNHATRPASQYGVVANNLFGLSTDGNAFNFDLKPQNGDYDEGLVDWMVENNVFVDNGVTIANMRLTGLRLVYIGNTKSGGGAANLQTGVNGSDGLPSGWGESYYTGRAS